VIGLTPHRLRSQRISTRYTMAQGFSVWCWVCYLWFCWRILCCLFWFLCWRHLSSKWFSDTVYYCCAS